MKWAQIKITTSQESSDAISNFLFELGAKSINIEESDGLPSNITLITDFVSDDLIGIRVKKIKKFINKLRAIGLETKPGSIEIESIEDKDWVKESRTHFPPKTIGENFVIAPTWIPEVELNQSKLIIRIDPGMAFGTGHHPSTRLSLELLEKSIDGGEKVADIGTGSGILSIASIMLGAKKVKAVDIDETSVTVAIENTRLNNVDKKIDVNVGEGLKGIHGKFHLIVSNILTSILLPMIPDFYKHLKYSGKLILSGIMDSEAYLIEDSIREHNFELIEKLVSDGWIGILAKKF